MRCAPLPATFLLLAAAGARGEEVRTAPPRYVVMCFCESTAGTPDNVIRLDNNAQILAAFTTPRTLDQVRAEGVPASASQVRLLRDWRLLADRDGKLQTTFKILGHDEAGALRDRTRPVAAKLMETIRPSLVSFLDRLEKTYPGSSYVVLFSHVLDGMVWERFREAGLVHEATVTAETPFWNGTLWGTWRVRPFFCGTNEYEHRGFTLKVAWNRAAFKGLGPLMQDADGVAALVKDVAEHQAVTAPALREKFQRTKVVGPQGQLLVPIIRERPDDAVHAGALALSKEIAAAVPPLVQADELRGRFGFATREEALIIAYHDLMWDLLEILEAEGLVHKPILFARPAEAAPGDAAQLVFGVWSTTP